MRNMIAVMACVIACAEASPSAAQPSPSPPALAGAWAGEDRYWATNIAGDVSSYVDLFDDGFTGWPCGAERPQTKADLVAASASLSATDGVKARVSLEDKAASGSGDHVVVYYRARLVQQASDGKVDEVVRNFTHTWVKRPGGWRIIGGMCRNDVRAK